MQYERRGRLIPSLKGNKLLKACSKKGIINYNCMFRLMMGFEDSKLSDKGHPICDEVYIGRAFIN